MNTSGPESPGSMRRGSDRPLEVYCDGRGARPDGKGSAYAWICADTGQQHVERLDGLTNNQAEYRAILSALSSFEPGSYVRIRTDSELVAFQLKGKYTVKDSTLRNLRAQIFQVLREKSLRVSVRWIPRAENRADSLLR
jgi:ribonuclease HI